MVLPRPFCRCAKRNTDTIASASERLIYVFGLGKASKGAWPSQDKAAAS